MAIDIVHKTEWVRILEEYLVEKRPPEEIRDRLDIGYKIENQSVIIHEIRPQFKNPARKIYPEIAKATFVKSKNHWKIFWLRSNLKWDPYEPSPIVKRLTDFLTVIEEDKYGCFWG